MQEYDIKAKHGCKSLYISTTLAVDAKMKAPKELSVGSVV
jgi:hypothetical protein